MSAHLRLLDNDPVEVRQLLVSALDALDQWQADLCADALWQLLEANIAKAGLAPREREVLCVLLRGQTGKEVARELGISRKTVENHVRHIYTKLGVTNRCSALLVLLGMVSPGKLRENPGSGRPNPPS